MVYNRNSIWLHLYTAYERMIIAGDLPSGDVLEAFRMNTDGPACPISNCYTATEFSHLLGAAGLSSEPVGGYVSKRELKSLNDSWAKAIADPRLGAKHRTFLRSLSFDFRGFPMHDGMHAGIGGVYRVHKPW
jgi:hypothetical protein